MCYPSDSSTGRNVDRLIVGCVHVSWIKSILFPDGFGKAEVLHQPPPNVHRILPTYHLPVQEYEPWIYK
jgi:hypothetical protein